MRADQIARLKDLQEKLADTFIMEADPANWPGSDKPPLERSQQERGDGYWTRKNAMATGGVLRFVSDILAKPERPPAEGGEGADHAAESDLDRAVREAERRSAKLVADAVARAKRKPEFDKRVHGD